MSDVFLSYSRDDQVAARRYADSLQCEGLSVWWDQALTVGESFDTVTEKALADASVVVVLWSQRSVESRWVRAEATQALNGNKLAPVMIEACKRPIMFELTHTADLVGWSGNTSDARWRSFVDGLQRIIAARTGAIAPSRPQTLPAAAAISSAPFSRKRFGWVTVALLLTVAAGAWWYLHAGDGVHGVASAASGAAVTREKVRVAVLPFENLSSDPGNAFFTDGLYEEILTALANTTSGLEVISRTTMESYKGKLVTVAQIARDLGCTHVLEGSVRRERDDVRLTLQLISAPDDKQVWANNYDRKLVSAMRLQSEVASEVARQLSAQFASPHAADAAAPTTNAEAYDLFLKARLGIERLAPSSAVEDWHAVEALLSQAIALDPNFTRAYVERFGLRHALEKSYDTTDVARRAAAADLAKAQALAPADPFVLAAAAAAEPDMARAVQLYEQAEAQGLSDAIVLANHASLLADMGQWDRAWALFNRAQSLDPGNANVQTRVLFAALSTHRPTEALRAAELFIARSPDEPLALWERGVTRFLFAGDLPALLKIYEDGNARIDWGANSERVGTFSRASNWHSRTVFLRFVGRYAELRTWVEANPNALIRSVGDSWWLNVPGLEQRPTAEYRGWADLLVGDHRAAAIEGRKLLEFSARQAPSDLPGAVLQSFIAMGHLFAAEDDAAIQAAHRTLEAARRSGSAYTLLAARYRTAQVLAWSGAQEEAVALLEDLAGSVPGLPPGVIARDPLFSKPLAGNVRFQALQARLEAQMSATQAEFSAVGRN